MYVVTFYSYKGGVGRTLALINTAYRLARAGKVVFVIDFDLEAPGIDEFRLCDGQHRMQGIVEYISRFTSEGEVPNLADFVYKASSPSTEPGMIWVMPAGKKDRDYQIALSRLDWKNFYSKQKGFFFVENLKEAIRQVFKPDYILIDSRTGLTDISGICTLQLPNLDVLIFNLNNQNVQGIAQIYRNVRDNKLGKEIETILVTSPIPEIPDSDLRRERLENARQVVGAHVNAVLPYDALVSLKETILIDIQQETPLSRAYDALTEEIISRNRSDVLTMLQNAKKLISQGSMDLAELRFQEMIETNPQSFVAWKEAGLFHILRGHINLALPQLEKAYSLNPRDHAVISQLATINLGKGNTAEALKFFNEFLALESRTDELATLANSFEKHGHLETALKAYETLSKSGIQKYHEMGRVYMRLGNYQRAYEKFSEGAKRLPNDLASIYNAGFALKKLGNTEAALGFFAKAIELFEKRDLASTGPALKANYLQSMSHAYAAVGQTAKARAFLEQAISIARTLTKTQIFSSLGYADVSPNHFIQESMHLLKQLRNH